MLYINDPKQKYVTYDDAINIAVQNGVEPKRAYIYLAALGVKSAMARVMSSDFNNYLPAIKIAVTGNGYAITSISVCRNCKGLHVK